jgi:hypothetical protein
MLNTPETYRNAVIKKGQQLTLAGRSIAATGMAAAGHHFASRHA